VQHVLRLVALVVSLGFASCVSVPGDTAAEKRAHVDAYADESIALLVKQTPEVQAKIDAAKGYAVIRQSVLKIPIFGGGSGWGVIVEKDTGKRTYVKLRRFDFGGGLGARVTRVIAVLSTPKALEEALDGGFEFNAGAEAGAKAGDVGGGVAGGAQESGSGKTVYVLLDTGASATATVGVLRMSKYGYLNDRDG
jgi:lipid-binding SYLF domain-containing protein